MTLGGTPFGARSDAYLAARVCPRASVCRAGPSVDDPDGHNTEIMTVPYKRP